MTHRVCRFAWDGLTVMTSGGVKPCCVGDKIGDLKDNTLREILDSETLNDVRRAMMQNKWHPVCTKCERDESLGLRSVRSGNMVDLISVSDVTQVDGSLTSVKLRNLDIRFSNICNFKCRMCNSKDSSLIAIEAKRIGKFIPTTVIYAGRDEDDLFNQLVEFLPDVQQIYFAGGEPLLHKDHWRILDLIVDSGRADQVILRYSTNGSTLSYMGKDALKYWRYFSDVQLHFSIDAIGERLEYWRSGAKFDSIISNVRACSEFSTSFNVTLGWPNLQSGLEFVKYSYDQSLMTTPKYNNVSYIHYPENLSIRHAPGFKKDQMKLDLYNFDNYVKERNIVEMQGVADGLKAYIDLNETAHQMSQCELIDIDRVRGEDFFKVFPEHEDMRPYLT